jgi:hypothetical protein
VCVCVFSIYSIYNLSHLQYRMNLADKCATHELYSLAADFYALSILKDHDAFRKPMVW